MKNILFVYWKSLKIQMFYFMVASILEYTSPWKINLNSATALNDFFFPISEFLEFLEFLEQVSKQKRSMLGVFKCSRTDQTSS